MAMRRSSLALVLAIAALALTLAAAAWLVGTQLAGQGSGTGRGVAEVGGPFTLTDQAGKRVSDAEFRGKLMLIYFGYSFCPDVCPTELQVMAAGVDALGERGADVVPIFITVDPERDTPKTLADYVPYFHDRLVGLTGSTEEIAAVTRAYRVYFAKAERDDGPYLMDHTSIVYLMGRDGRFLQHFTSGTTPQDMAAAIAQHL